jgi:hypothetical protein
LAARRGALSIRTINADLLGFRAHMAMPVDVIVCMGDTLTHLPNHSSVASLLEDAASILKPGGVFVATFRMHDVLHLREGAAWRLRVSSYPKLRLAPEWVAERLSSLGLAVHRDTTSGGMIRIAARKPGPPGAVESDRLG